MRTRRIHTRVHTPPARRIYTAPRRARRERLLGAPAAREAKCRARTHAPPPPPPRCGLGAFTRAFTRPGAGSVHSHAPRAGSAHSHAPICELGAFTRAFTRPGRRERRSWCAYVSSSVSAKRRTLGRRAKDHRARCVKRGAKSRRHARTEMLLGACRGRGARLCNREQAYVSYPLTCTSTLRVVALSPIQAVSAPPDDDEPVPRIPRGRGMKLDGAMIARIGMTLALLVMIVVTAKPCANATSKFVTGFGEEGSRRAPRDAQAGQRRCAVRDRERQRLRASMSGTDGIARPRSSARRPRRQRATRRGQGSAAGSGSAGSAQRGARAARRSGSAACSGSADAASRGSAGSGSAGAVPVVALR